MFVLLLLLFPLFVCDVSIRRLYLLYKHFSRFSRRLISLEMAEISVKPPREPELLLIFIRWKASSITFAVLIFSWEYIQSKIFQWLDGT